MKQVFLRIILIIIASFIVFGSINCFLIYLYTGEFSNLLVKIYVFHAVFALLTGSIVLLFKAKIGPTIGFFFLYMFIAKIAMFLLNFSDFIFAPEKISQGLKISTLFAHVLFLWIEVYAYNKLLADDQEV